MKENFVKTGLGFDEVIVLFYDVNHANHHREHEDDEEK
jgi:hypothetical protein